MEALTIDKLKEVMREVQKLSGPVAVDGFLSSFGGFTIYDNPILEEPEEYEITVQLTPRQRWIEPVLNWQTQPFEPWVKTRKETRVRMRPMRQIFQVGNNAFIMHPAMRSELINATTV